MNINFWDIPADLQFRLLASCGLGQRERHPWIDMPARRKGGDKLFDFMLSNWPQANDREIDILIAQMDTETFVDFVRSCGCSIEEEKELVTAYERHTGKEPTTKRKSSRRT